jgi:hypothetical protein
MSELSTATKFLAAASGVFTAALLTAGPWHADAQQGDAPPRQVYGSDDDYGYGTRLSPAEREGRDTWYFWTGGNEKFWVEMARHTDGNVDLLNYVDSRRHGKRFRDLGAITQPGCEAATGPDQYGLWIDRCDQPPVPGVPGEPTGVVGLRKFPNPKFDAAKWNAAAYYKDPNSSEPPYLIGMACGFCHVGFNPLNPPADPERPRWANLAGTIGNQYWEEGRLFNLKMKPDDFRWHIGNKQPAGTSDTSRFATDHINNPNAINTIFNLASRPTTNEKMRNGSMRAVPHILKDGADSVGVAGASLRVYVNIGMCADYWTTLHDPVSGLTPQKPFDMEFARLTCPDWRATESRMENAEAFLKTMLPVRLKDAPYGERYLTKDPDVLTRGKAAFAASCARCHSSKQPPDSVAGEARTQWFREAVLRDDFLESNFLSDDKRYSVRDIGTNFARAAGTNAIKGHVWEQFSSESYKELPAVGRMNALYNPRKPTEPITFNLEGGGRGYYRTASLTSIWATAPFLHNNSVGIYVKNPSVEARVTAFIDAMEKMLWPEKRLGVQSIPVTSVDSTLLLTNGHRLTVPAGTPIDLIARINPMELPRILRNRRVMELVGDRKLFDGMLRRNQAPDFVSDHGHTFGANLADDDKRALIEFLKTF